MAEGPSDVEPSGKGPKRGVSATGTIRLRDGGSALTIDRSIVDYSNAVYLLVSPRRYAYPKAASRVLYIGRTRFGADRILSSLSERIWKAFRLHGVRSLEVYVVHWKGRRSLNSSRHAENAFLVAFRQLYGRVPLLNNTGEGLDEDEAFEWFSRPAVVSHLRKFGWKRM